jgi:hypothetical protein
VEYQLIDADEHYYEPDDCFTRHIEARFRDETIRVRRDGDGLGRVFLRGRRTFMSVMPGDRLALMDEQGVQAAIMLPTLGVTVEYGLRSDVALAYASLRGFNRWLEEAPVGLPVPRGRRDRAHRRHRRGPRAVRLGLPASGRAARAP